jgi:hypothetical protein
VEPEAEPEIATASEPYRRARYGRDAQPNVLLAP